MTRASRPRVAGSVLGVTGLSTPTVSPVADRPAAGGFRNARPCSQTYGTIKAKFQADGKTPLPKFKGKTLPTTPSAATRRSSSAGPTAAPPPVSRARASASASSTPTRRRRSCRTRTPTPRRHGDTRVRPRASSRRSLPKHVHAAPERVPTPSGWYGEETLDVEAVHGMAPEANVRYYGAKSCLNHDLADTLDARRRREQGLDRLQLLRRARVRRDARATSSPTSRSFQQGAMQGITFLFSSGDNGDEQASDRHRCRPTTRPPTRTSRRSAARPTAIGADGNARCSRPAGARDKYNALRRRQACVDAGRAFLYGAGGGFSTAVQRGPATRTASSRRRARARAYPDVGAGRRPDDGHAGRGDADLPGRHLLRRVPHRRHEPRLAADGRASQALAQQRAGSRLGFLNPAHLQDGEGAPRRLQRRRPDRRTRQRPRRTSRTASTRPTASSTASARSTRTRA